MSIVRRALAALLAAALVALGVVVVVEVVLAALGRPAWVLPYGDVAATLRDNSWSSALARAVAAGLCLLGLLLLVLALRRGRPAALPLVPVTEGVEAAVSRRGLQAGLSREAGQVDGVRRARVEVGRRRVTVRATSSLREPAGVPEQVEQRVRRALDELDLQRALRIRVRTTRRT